MINWESTLSIHVKTLYGLEDLLKEELHELKLEDIKVQNRMVSGKGTLEHLYRICLHARLALHAYLPIKSFRAKSEQDLYNQALVLPWEKLIGLKDTFAINFTVHSPFFKHGKYASLKLKDAIVDRIRNTTGKRPYVDTEDPTYFIHIHISHQNVSILLDGAGESLHKREYRTATVAAPLNEVLAAGLIKTTRWNGDRPFLDPMCGSGTLPIEAAMLARGIPSGWYRSKFAFMNWPSFNALLWEQIRQEARTEMRPLMEDVMMFDRSSKAISIARYNRNNAGLDKWIKAEALPFEKNRPSGKPGILFMNPPYGERMRPDEINRFYKSIGDQLKKRYSGWEAWIVSSNIQALRSIGLRPDKKFKFFNGALEVQLVKYVLRKGEFNLKKQIPSLKQSKN